MDEITARVFIGYDSREAAAFSVLSHSINSRASIPVSTAPLMLSQLGGAFSRPRESLQSSDFSFTRFLTPYLAGYEGWAMFMDCDMVMLEDIANLWALRDDRYAVMCVQHDHVPNEEKKFLNEIQTKYAYKNWSSVMLFNCAKCQTLTPEFVNSATGLQLHQFKWLDGDDQIGALPSKWNHLVGYDEPRNDAALVHYTIGGPYFEEFRDCEYADEWFSERESMLYCLQKNEIAAPKTS